MIKTDKINIQYYTGITLTCIVAIVLMPLYMLVRAVVGAFVLLIDTAMLPYESMVIYHNNFQVKIAKLEETDQNWKN